ncbi:MAG: sulfatase-like hydrolase/transferase [Bryobacteraceae bacterium]
MIGRRSFLGVLGGAAAHAQSMTERPPNVVFLLFDKCRTDAIGAYGERKVHTPHLDALAKEGVRFQNCFTPQALCGPARASILTGLAPHAHGLRRNVYPANPGNMNSNYPEAIPDPFRDKRFKLWDNFVFYLSNAGYATAHIGKWHLGPGNPGFYDYFKSFNSTLRHWIGEPHQSRYRPDVHTELGMQFIQQHAHEPFFLYQSYYAPHEPSDPPKQWLEHYRGDEHAGYYGSVTNLDWNVGRIVEALKKANVWGNTLFVMTTEHGRSWDARPGTLEGICTSYEETSRIPLLLRYPKRLPQGKVWNSGVTLTDIAPTILDAAGVQAVKGGIVEPPLGPVFPRQSLIERVKRNEDRWTEPVILENIPQAAMDGSYFDERAVRTEHHKLILRKFDARPEMRAGELYDLRVDKEEKRNLWASQRETVRQLSRQLEQWAHAQKDEVGLELAGYGAR